MARCCSPYDEVQSRGGGYAIHDCLVFNNDAILRYMKNSAYLLDKGLFFYGNEARITVGSGSYTCRIYVFYRTNFCPCLLNHIKDIQEPLALSLLTASSEKNAIKY